MKEREGQQLAKPRETEQEVYRTEYDLAAIEHTNEFIPRSLVVVDLQ